MRSSEYITVFTAQKGNTVTSIYRTRLYIHNKTNQA